jgi:protein SCO1/2
VMNQYSKKFHSEPGRWYFLTGSTDAVMGLIKSFKLPPPIREPKKTVIDHSNQLVLVDARSRVRGYYDGTQEADVKRLIKDVSQLAEHTVQ